MIHRQCAPLQLNWKDINFNAFGHSREAQQAKAFVNFRETMERNNIQFNTFRLQIQQKLNDIDAALARFQSTPTAPPKPSETTTKKPTTTAQSSTDKQKDQTTKSELSSTIVPTEPTTTNITEELSRLSALLEEALAGQVDRRGSHDRRIMPGSITSASSIHHQQSTTQKDPAVEPFTKHLNERVTDLQLSVNRLHQDVSAIRHVIERISPLSASLILGRTSGRR